VPRSLLIPLALLAPLALTSCRNSGFPDTPSGYREYAFVTNAGANTVSVLDLVYVRTDRTLQVGAQPTAIAASPTRNEIYVVNTQSSTLSILDADQLRVALTIPLHRTPTAIAVDPSGHRAYITNSASNTISTIDLDQRRELSTTPTPDQPTDLILAPDTRTLLVTHRPTGTISLYTVSPKSPLKLRNTYTNCPGAASPVILPDSSKAFIACSSGHQVMVLNLAADPASWNARQNPTLTSDQFLTLLDVGLNPTHLALKPDGGEIFTSNLNSDTISEIDTQTNEVGSTSIIGAHPARGIVSKDNSLYVANSTAANLTLYSIDDGKRVSFLPTGTGPQALAFSADQHLLLALDTHSGDVSVIRTQSKLGPNLFTILPAGDTPTAIVTKVIQTTPKT
jgi:YVTN family beta-propeller protein